MLDAARAYQGTSHKQVLDDIVARLHEPLRVAIAGKVKAGKSTLLNALVGDELAPTDEGECTRIVTWYRHGITYRVTLRPRGGAPRQVPFTRNGGPDRRVARRHGRRRRREPDRRVAGARRWPA